MPYWGNGPIDNDYAFDAIGAYVHLIRERMFKDAETVIDRAHAEQGIVASLQCLRVLDAEFPKCVRVTFRRMDLERAVTLFDAWCEVARSKLPEERLEAVKASAEAEFRRYRDQLDPPA